ncbi:hypothetical protein LXL04_013955 [Taraxacum kok-saghyz]
MQFSKHGWFSTFATIWNLMKRVCWIDFGFISKENILVGRILSLSKIHFKGKPICPFCNNASESIDHLLARCEYTQEVFAHILRWCSILARHFSNISDIFDFASTLGNCLRK